MSHSTLQFDNPTSGGTEIHDKESGWIGTIIYDNKRWVVETYDDWLWSREEMLDIIEQIDILSSNQQI